MSAVLNWTALGDLIMGMRPRSRARNVAQLTRLLRDVGLDQPEAQAEAVLNVMRPILEGAPTSERIEPAPDYGDLAEIDIEQPELAAPAQAVPVSQTGAAVDLQFAARFVHF